jgi:FAD/FMN-containing dehydrogenase
MTKQEGAVRFGDADAREFKRSLRGEVVLPGDAGYDDARSIWNGSVDKRPAVIARCADAADVAASLAFARENGLSLSVRGGGHSAAGSALCDEGLTIDLTRMKAVEVDAERRIARADGGLLLGDLDRATQAHGLATTAGVVSHTGIAGLTLGGGIGYLGRQHGLTCDNLLGVDLVAADGRRLRASADENPDLFWGVRGGGGNFGVVTSFEYRLHPVGPTVLAGNVVHPVARARDVLRFYSDFSLKAPDELATNAVLRATPEGEPIVAIAVCYAGRLEDGEKAIEPLRSFGAPLEDDISEIAYTEFQTVLDDVFAAGQQYYWRSRLIRQISDGLIDALLDHFARVPSPQSLVVFQQTGGAASRIGPEETAFFHRDSQYDLIMASIWTDPRDSEANVRWARAVGDAVAPFGSEGVYVNNVIDEGREQVRATYGGNYDRLVALKNEYDPTNLFRLNANIEPSV